MLKGFWTKWKTALHINSSHNGSHCAVKTPWYIILGRFSFMKKFFLSIITGGIIVLIVIILIATRHIFRSPAPAAQVPAEAPQTRVTIIEGWNNNQIASDLDYNANRADAPHLATSTNFLAEQKNFDVSAYTLLASKPASADLEGFLFPDTYFLPEPATNTDESAILITKALDNFSVKFTPQMQADAQKQGMTVFQIVTMASIIEKETSGLDTERGVVAGLFYNRLNAGMPLQSDATVNFVTGGTSPSVSIADTKIDSPYNTYLYKGLPPGPICNPSLSSLMAAIYPTQTNYLYFLTDPATGKAIFATTFQEQLDNQQKYLGQ